MTKSFSVKLNHELTIPAGSTIKTLPSLDDDIIYLEITTEDNKSLLMRAMTSREAN